MTDNNEVAVIDVPQQGAEPMTDAQKIEAAVAKAKAEQDAADSGRGLISKIKDTNTQYRGLMTDAKTFGEGTGLTKAKSGKGLSSMSAGTTTWSTPI